MKHEFTAEYARGMDADDDLYSYRSEFLFPRLAGRQALYFTGNSLGLQPRKAGQYIQEELEDWARFGVHGHIESRRPWVKYHEFFQVGLSRLVGAKPSEVVAMNGLTTNLHLLMVSFYRPQGKRTRIICEGKAFPSDQYALRSQMRFHGLNPDDHLIEIEPDPETGIIPEDKILKAVEENTDQLAMLLMGGVNYYTGQYFNIQKITKAVQQAGGIAGWDLAHAAGNVELSLHDWNVDFAAWCGYKYLNSGPGGISGVFIHQRHHAKKDIPRFEGWWGHNKETRFSMPGKFEPMPTAEAWQLSNAPVFAMAPFLASLELFDQAGMPALRAKSEKLTSYLEYVIKEVAHQSGENLSIITPSDPQQRGCQLSVIVPHRGRNVFENLSRNGVVTDWREPDVIRLAPVPLYNSFEDIYEFTGIFLKALKNEG